MTQRLFGRRRLDGFLGPGSKWATGCSEDRSPYVSAIARRKRLENRIVLGIDRENRRARACRASHEKPARANEAFLVGEGDRRATFDGGKRRFQSNRTADRRHHPVSRALRRLHQCIFSGRGFYARAGKRLLQLGVCGVIGNDRMSRADFTGNLSEGCCVATRTDRLDAISMRSTLDQVKRAGAN